MTSAAEASVATLIGETYTGAAAAAPAASAPAPATPADGEVDHFSFDANFQTQIVRHVARDASFMRKVGHILRPEYFENVGEAALVAMVLEFWQTYGSQPNKVALYQVIRDWKAKKRLRAEVQQPLKDAVLAAYIDNPDLSNGDYFAQEVATFARYQAMGEALLRAVGHREKGRFDLIERDMQAAMAVAVNADGESYNYWTKIGERTKRRQDRLAGVLPPTGVTTGIYQLDQLLYHKGWGKRELSALSGGPKVGKTTALLNFAKAASLGGHNVLYATCEVAKDIIADRADASVTDTLMKEVGTRIHDVESKVRALAAKAGALQIHEYSSGTLKPSMLRALIERYKAPQVVNGETIPAIKFDLVVVDYADIMDSDRPYDGDKGRMTWIWIDLRAIANDEDVAMLTATAINRDGIKATVAKMGDIADDINKVRTVDLMIGINITDEERANNEARLYFMASRNQESGFTVHVKQDIARMVFIRSIIKVE
jgi:replicative DNA helicase